MNKESPDSFILQMNQAIFDAIDKYLFVFGVKFANYLIKIGIWF